MDKFCCVCEISDMSGAVAVTGKNDRKFIAESAVQDLCGIRPGVSSVAAGCQRCFVDLKDHVFILGCSGESIVIYREMGIIAMPQNFDCRMFHGINICLGVLRNRTGSVILSVHADDGVIQIIQQFI